MFSLSSFVFAQVSSETPGWFEFVVPGLDASSTSTDMSFLNPDPAGERGPIRVEGERFVDGSGERIRFLGTNLTFESAFPDKEVAPKVAAHMRKLGLNVVRFHHMDNRTAPGGIWLESQTGFDPEQIDRLDWMVYQLKQNGIYTNLNLHVSRNYPGLPDDIRAFRYGKVLDHFYRPFIEMQKQYARDLLTHRNPYTGTTYAEEPAVAFVEINNENTLVRSWADLLDAPEPFQGALQEQWIVWLRSHYPDTAALRKVWDVAREPLSAELLQNGDFSGGTVHWQLETGNTARGTLEATSDGPDGTSALHVHTLARGEQPWNLQIHQTDLDLEDGAVYTLHFQARSDAERAVDINTRLQQSPWRSVGLQKQIHLMPEWQSYEFIFQAQDPEPGLTRLTFGLRNTLGHYWFANVSLRRGGFIGLPEGKSLEAGNIALPPTDAPEGIRRDFWQFLIDTEMAYSEEMVHFLKEDLAIRPLVSITQASYGGIAGVHREATLADYVDMHSYWQHPRFPNRPWSRTDWNIANTSMVNDRSGGTLTRLALHRVAGKPFAVSEYDHPAPSDYAAEMFPMIASFAALQDWDALYQFSYGGRDWDRRRIGGYFSINGHPGKLVFLPIAAILFRMAAVTAAEETSLLVLPAESVIEQVTRHGTNARATWQEAAAGTALEARTEGGLDPDPISWLPIRTAVAVDIGADELDRPTLVSGVSWMREPWQSRTSEIVWDRRTPDRGLYLVNAPAVRAAVGYLGGRSIEVGDVRIEMPHTETDWASVALAALDGKPISESERMLLVAVGRVENTNMGWDADRTSVSDRWGSEPTVAEGIPLTVTLPDGGTLSVQALDGTGLPKAALVRDRNEFRFQVGPEQETLWYLIERSKQR